MKAGLVVLSVVLLSLSFAPMTFAQSSWVSWQQQQQWQYDIKGQQREYDRLVQQRRALEYETEWRENRSQRQQENVNPWLQEQIRKARSRYEQEYGFPMTIAPMQKRNY